MVEEVQISDEELRGEPVTAVEGTSGYHESTERAPYPTRLRVVLLLALLCWAVLIAIIAWLVSLL